MDIVNLLITLVSGAIGGNVAGAALPADKSLGGLGNTIAGLVGGTAGNYILQALGILSQLGLTGGAAAAGGAAGASGFDIGHLLATVGSSGVTGALLTALVGYIKSQTQKS